MTRRTPLCLWKTLAVPSLVWAAFVLGGCSSVRLVSNPPIGTLTISSSAANPGVRIGESQQFTATVTGSIDQSVEWRVNGVSGGNLQFGVISSSGLYTSPRVLPVQNDIEIQAVSIADRSVSTSMKQSLWNPIPEIDSVNAPAAAIANTPSTVNFTITGKNFVSEASALVAGKAAPTNFISSTQLTVSAAAPPGQGVVEFRIANPEPGSAGSNPFYVVLNHPDRPSRSSVNVAAARFLDQATFGATAADIQSLQNSATQLGSLTAAYSAWIDQQMDANQKPVSYLIDPSNTPPVNAQSQQLCGDTRACVKPSASFAKLCQPDQLRQRVSLALSEMWVISFITVRPTDSYVAFNSILQNDAFKTYDKLMNDVTLSSGMGFYLDMGNSNMPTGTSIANENYARELMQLFTLGVYQINDDGTFILDGTGNTQATYSETDIQNLARALTGWTYAPLNGNPTVWRNAFNGSLADRTMPMQFVDAHHDIGAKNIFSCSLPASQMTLPDLNAALLCIFNHPNMPAFVSRQLIQHLVTSNPSPAYIQRIANVFKDDGSSNHVRGNLMVVVKAILLDPEARVGDFVVENDTSGHLREPVLFITGIIRGLCGNSINSQCYTGAVSYSGTNTQGTYTLLNTGFNLSGLGSGMGQNILFSPSVFNYFAPDYVVPSAAYFGPEFQILTSASSPIRANFADSVVRNSFTVNGIDITTGLNKYFAMAATPDAMVNQLEQDFMHGQMGASMKQAIVSAVTALPNNNATDATYRAKMALYQVLSSSQYQVVH